MMATNDHPLTSRPETDLSAVPMNERPRFTASEALILNALVNAAPEAVGIGQLRKLVLAFSYTFPTTGSIMAHVGSIRAKLGERVGSPTRLVSVRAARPGSVPKHRVLAGYRWVDRAMEDDA